MCENLSSVSAGEGFPNPASDSPPLRLDLTSWLIKQPASVYFMRIAGDAWREQGIFTGDLVLVDRSLRPRRADLTIWWEGDSFQLGHGQTAPAGTPIWGVVTHTIHQFRGA
jgi:DNA polymerase V